MGFENGKLVRVSLRATRGTQQQVNTFHYDLKDFLANPANDPQSLADLFRDNVRPQWQAAYKSDWVIQPVEVVEEKDPLNPTAPRSAWSSGAPINGNRDAFANDVTPSFQCAVVKLTTDHIGRRYTGRLFLGGSFLESDSDGDSWNASELTRLEARIAAIPLQPDISTGVSDSTANWCVYSRTSRAQNIDPYAAHITGHNIRTLVHSLRSRAAYS